MAFEHEVEDSFRRWIESRAGQACADSTTLVEEPAHRTELARRLSEAYREGVMCGELLTKAEMLRILDKIMFANG